MSRREPLIDVTNLMKAEKLSNPMAALKQLVPSAFSMTPRPGVSKRYAHIPTSDVVEHLVLRGWNLDSAGEAIVNASRQGMAPWVAHTVVLRHEDFTFGKLKKDQVFPTILLSNSHDTSTAVVLRMGFKRCWCDNQNVVSLDKHIEASRFRHSGNSRELMERLYAALGKLEEGTKQVGQVINAWSKLELSRPQRLNYFDKVTALRTARVSELATNNMELFDTRLRPEDQGNDLFTVYQVAQEHMVRGLRTEVFVDGQKLAQRSLMRPMSSTKAFVNFNEKLFALTDEFAGSLN